MGSVVKKASFAVTLLIGILLYAIETSLVILGSLSSDPRGSIVGPLLVNIFINDFVMKLSILCAFYSLMTPTFFVV